MNDLYGFSQTEAARVINNRVCAQDWGELSIVEFEGQATVQVVCSQCGKSVEVVGHIAKSTPAIIMENAKFAYREVVRNLPDLFPQAKKSPSDQAEILKSLGF